MYNATKYLRLSYTSDRANESDSIANQRKYIDEFVKRNPDIKIVNEQVDDGYSGIVFDRPAFKAMIEDIKSGKINCVIVKDLSRLGREYNETFTYLRRIFPALGVRFIAINDNIDTAKEAVTGDISVSFITESLIYLSSVLIFSQASIALSRLLPKIIHISVASIGNFSGI
ncbi:MAG TPA: hypothetical protein DEP65_07470 [Ruminococcus sp.]|nr:hypothetical protein [Ruminococcus sp.]